MVSNRGLRSRIGDGLRRLRLLALADRVNLWRHIIATAPANRRFGQVHADFVVPPARLAFEAYGHVDAEEYLVSGRNHAKVFVELIRDNIAYPATDVLEWGCGSGRIIRQLKDLGLGAHTSVIGVDVDTAAIAWCRAYLKDCEFMQCGHAPPLPFDGCTIDAVYHFSVWTHLSGVSIEAWVAEFARILRPDGAMIGTSHGDSYVDMLFPDEKSAYDRGEAVERAGFREGRKYFLGFHPPLFLRALLGRWFERVQHIPATRDPAFPQDIWIASGPKQSDVRRDETRSTFW